MAPLFYKETNQWLANLSESDITSMIMTRLWFHAKTLLISMLSGLKMERYVVHYSLCDKYDNVRPIQIFHDSEFPQIKQDLPTYKHPTISLFANLK